MNKKIISQLSQIGFDNIIDQGRLLIASKGSDDIEDGKSLLVLNLDTKENTLDSYMQYQGNRVDIIKRHGYDNVEDLATTLLKNRIISSTLSV